MKNIACWKRVEFENTPIYIHPEIPDWFVPNNTADMALRKSLLELKPTDGLPGFEQRLSTSFQKDYTSRADLHKLSKLKECWLHITNKCNMSCAHCMFKSSSHARDELSTRDCLGIINEAYDLGTRIFYFTGGEPLLSDSLLPGISDILARAETRVVVLTNLSLLSKNLETLKKFRTDRLHFQVSIDGMQEKHDTLRGPNTFNHLDKNLTIIRELGFPVSLAMTITSHNVTEMADIVDFAARKQVANVHYLWLFKKGNANEKLYVKPEKIFTELCTAQLHAEKVGVTIDNIEILKSQIFSCPGTRYDLSNAGWQSLAVGPNKQVYPTPALIYETDLQCGHVSEGLHNIWRESKTLTKVRDASLKHSKTYSANLFKYIVGGGDIDHSYIHHGELTGGDPYVELYNNIAKWLIVREAQKFRTNGFPAITLKMGEHLMSCPAEGEDLFFTRSNCILSLPGIDNRTRVNHFYSNAAKDTREDILNPICYEDDLVEHIPEKMRYRSYGCGSPVIEAHVKTGETVVDLGSGTGIECFIASKLTGPGGRIIGVDMGDSMLSLAETAKKEVIKNLNYDNIEFKKSYLEDLPLLDESADLIISNCVLNLSPDKREVFSEIFRVLKPGGRLVISDITYDGNIPLSIKYNEKLRGECIGGALQYQNLFGMLNDFGFTRGQLLKGYLYRSIKEHDFYSITYQAFKPTRDEKIVLYDFPEFDSILKNEGTEPACACFRKADKPDPILEPVTASKKVDCMVCGSKLIYSSVHEEKKCHFCNRQLPANACCADGHFVCDDCHQADAVDIIRKICLYSKEIDAYALMQLIRSHPHFSIHGPEHHSMVPAVILTALKNNGNEISNEQVLTAIHRGTTIAGGSCAFLGMCGAAVGVGIAFSVLLEATPYDGGKRQEVQKITQYVLGEISEYAAPRCCQRDCWLALQAASKLLKDKLNMTFKVSSFPCKQFQENKECIFDECPLWQEA